MNMLNPEFRALASFSDDEKELFYKVGKENVEYLTANALWKSDFVDTDWYDGGIYRLKLKEGGWYKIKSIHGHDYYYKCASICDDRLYNEINEMYLLYSDIESIRPATQEEINSVKPSFKPSFKRGDVLSSKDSECRIIIFRLESKESHIHMSLSKINKVKEFSFSGSCCDNNCLVKRATPDQIKQLELEEIKHGKKWNGEGYDYWLTADGLTLNELLEHDLSEIEYYENCEWRKTYNNRGQMLDFVIKRDVLNLYRLKPQETFVDVKIRWGVDGGEIVHPLDRSLSFTISDKPIYYTTEGLMLLGYEMSNGQIVNRPVIPNENRTAIKERAVNARFVKVGE